MLLWFCMMVAELQSSPLMCMDMLLFAVSPICPVGFILLDSFVADFISCLFVDMAV